MAKVKAKISAKSGRSGTRIAVAQFRVTPSDKPKGKPFYRTRARMNLHIRSGERPTEFKFIGTS